MASGPRRQYTTKWVFGVKETIWPAGPRQTERGLGVAGVPFADPRLRPATGVDTVARISQNSNYREIQSRQTASAARRWRSGGDAASVIIGLGRAEAIERVVRPHRVQSGLSLTEFAVLEVLYHKAPCHWARFGPDSRDRREVPAYVVKKLEARGLMRRRVCAEDSRVVSAN